MEDDIEELKKQLVAAADVLIGQIISRDSPVSCPERVTIQSARIDFYPETLATVFSCPGHADMSSCRECKIKGTFQVGTPRGKNVT